MRKLRVSPFARHPLLFLGIMVLFCMLSLFLFPPTRPHMKPAAYASMELYEESPGSSSVEYYYLNLTEPVYRESVFGNFEPTHQLNGALNRPGDHGRAYSVEGRVSLRRVEELKSEYGMNMAVSDRIPMNRIIPDLRHPECKYWHYPLQLPTVSVIIVAHNEGFSTLMRTVHSVLLQSPQRYLREVLLIDDCSDTVPLHTHLEQYLGEHFGPFKLEFQPQLTRASLQGERLGAKSGKVRLLRNGARLGLIGSRVRGAREALAPVLVFLDAHCEVNRNWLVPLLAPISSNDRTLTVPLVDTIDWRNFSYRATFRRYPEAHYMGIWEWGLLYKETPLNMVEHLQSHQFTEPYESPTHAGGLLAISRRFFFELGGYDAGLLGWGGENFELSFKVWQCGGRLLWVPCSRVGHVYRPFMPYSLSTLASQRKGPLIVGNYKRVVEVWLEEPYKSYFYARQPLALFYPTGNLSAQLGLKSALHCASFDWFISKHGNAIFKSFPRLPANQFWGHLRSVTLNASCLHSPGKNPPAKLGLYPCVKQKNWQLFRLNIRGQLGYGERCILGSTGEVNLHKCKTGTVDGPWTYENDSKQMRYSGQLCLTVRGSSAVALDLCHDPVAGDQQWTWQPIQPLDL